MNWPYIDPRYYYYFIILLRFTHGNNTCKVLFQRNNKLQLVHSDLASSIIL